MNPCIEGPIGSLRLVLEVDLGKHQTYRFRSWLAALAAVYDAGDVDVSQLDDEIFQLVFASFPVRDGRVFQVQTCRARFQQPRRCLVDLVDDGKIVEGRLAAGATGGRSVLGPLRRASRLSLTRSTGQHGRSRSQGGPV
jgi:hypothetical protein